MAQGPSNGGVPVGIGTTGKLTGWLTPTVVGASSVNTADLSGVNTGDVTLTASGTSPNANGALLTGQALTLETANGSFAGLLSALNYLNINNFFQKGFYNVLDNGISTANSAATNLTAINALLSSITDNSTIWFPPSTSAYQFSGNVAIPSGKHLKFLGGGENKSIVQITSATADFFTCGDWYQEFEGLQFSASVVRSAGAFINSGNNVGIRVVNCQMVAPFNGIVFTGGSSAGNLALIDKCNITNAVNFSVQVDGQNANMLINNLTCDCSPASAVHVEVNQCGSLLLSNCDLIRATNNMRLNPDSGTKGVFSVYCTNVFFDTAAGSSVKYQGAGTTNIQRSKYVNCWFSSSVQGIEFASTATMLPTAIDFVNCDIYFNSVNGILANGVQDFSLDNCRIAQNATAGLNINASTGAVTKFNVQNNTIGPTAGATANGTGILINAGTYGGYIITGNNVAGNTTSNINDGGSVTGFNQKQVQDNVGQALQGQLDALAAPTAGFNTVETILAGGLNVSPIPANAFVAKDSVAFKIWGTCTATVANNTTIRIRIGTAGTTADTAVFTGTIANGAAAGTTIPFEINGLMTIRTVGAAATVHGTMTLINQSVTSNATASTGIVIFADQVYIPTFAAFNSTVNNYITLTAVTAATTTTHTIQGAVLDYL